MKLFKSFKNIFLLALVMPRVVILYVFFSVALGLCADEKNDSLDISDRKMMVNEKEGTGCSLLWNDNHLSILEVELGGGTKYHGLNPTFFNVNFGMEVFRNVLVSVSYQHQMDFYRSSGIKTYCRNNAIGGGLSYRIFKSDYPETSSRWWDSSDYLAFRARYFHTIGNADRSGSVYEIGLVYYILHNGSMKISISPTYRFVDSYSSLYDDYSGFVLSLGFGI